MRTDIVITKADKVGTIIIQNEENYIEEPERQFDDKGYYEQVPIDPTCNHQNAISSMTGSFGE